VIYSGDLRQAVHAARSFYQFVNRHVGKVAMGNYEMQAGLHAIKPATFCRTLPTAAFRLDPIGC
jgi:hypothetical protein